MYNKPTTTAYLRIHKQCFNQKKVEGIVRAGDRIFAFAKDLDLQQAKLFEKSVDERKGKWNKK